MELSERQTPETEAAIIDELDVELVATGSGRWKGDTKMQLVPADFARKLERERDEAREGQIEALCDFQLLARKIDDIRDVFDHQDEDWTGSIPLADAVSKVIRERDEAREALREIRLLLTSLPRDRNGLPIIPCETYVTTDGVECKPRFLIDFGVSVSQGDRYRQCTPQDVILQANNVLNNKEAAK